MPDIWAVDPAIPPDADAEGSADWLRYINSPYMVYGGTVPVPSDSDPFFNYTDPIPVPQRVVWEPVSNCTEVFQIPNAHVLPPT
jgi:hypothetical protein